MCFPVLGSMTGSSTSLPSTTFLFVFGTISVFSLVLIVMACDIELLTSSLYLPPTLLGSQMDPATQDCMTVIMLVVSVPVLSEQIVVALPIVSHALDVLTMFWSVIILRTLKAKAMVTARGRPSGTATTKMVMPVMRKPIHCELCTALFHCSLQHSVSAKRTPKRMKRTMMMPPPKRAPTLVMRMVMASSLTCRIDLPDPSSSSSSSPLSPSKICS
mmetsp:Transcript_24048/g.60402  ORF Transcript_24048/g.60402 Transcript_24048/m.60402 type:complete len:216 (-) Transcript_24048:959-1606(-)